MKKHPEAKGKPIPDDWDGENYCLYMICVPDSLKWTGYVKGAIYDLTRGRKWDARTGNIRDAQKVAWEIFDSMANVDDFVKTQRMLVAALTGTAVDLDAPLPTGVVDYTEDSPAPGVIPVLRELLMVDRSIFGETTIADILLEGLVGNKISIPIPFEGKGLADIVQDEVDTLHNRFRMSDASIFNPLLGEKNIVEALETLLRTDKATDLEFLTPNIVTTHNALFKLQTDGFIGALFATVWSWLTGSPPEEAPEFNTTAELLMLIASALQKLEIDGGGDMTALVAAVEGIQSQTTVNVEANCGHGAGCGCGGGGIDFPSEPGEEGQPPPDGWEEPTNPVGSVEYTTRKCKVANIIHAQSVEFLVRINDTNITKKGAELYGDSMARMMFITIGYILGELSLPIPILDGLAGAAIGFFSDLVPTLAVDDADLDDLIAALNANEQELICALHDAPGAILALDDYLQVLNSNGVNLANINIMAAIMVPNVLNWLFFPSTINPSYETALETYIPPIDCSSCTPTTIDAVCYTEDFAVDLGGWAIDPAYSGSGSWTLTHRSSLQRMDLDLDGSGGGSEQLRVNFSEPYQQISYESRLQLTWRSGYDMDVVRFTIVDENDATIHSITESGYGDETILTTDEPIPEAQVGRLAAGMIIEVSRANGDAGLQLSDIAIANCLEVNETAGTRLSKNQFQSEFRSSNNFHYVGITFSECGQCPTVTITNLSGFTAKVGDFAAYRLASDTANPGTECNGWDLHCSENPFALPVSGVRHITLRSDVAFTATIDWTED